MTVSGMRRIWRLLKAFSRIGLILSGLVYLVALADKNPLFLEVVAVVSSVFIVARIQALKEENDMRKKIKEMMK